MRERVREHGGRFEIRSSETGTELLVTIPLEAERTLERPVAAAGSSD
jgi:signal transduction histidine kinase